MSQYWRRLPFHIRLPATVLIGLLALTACQRYMVQWITARSMEEKDRSEATVLQQVAGRTMDKETAALGQLVDDNCMWKEFYEAAQKRDTAWIKTNLLDATWIIPPSVIRVAAPDGTLLGRRGITGDQEEWKLQSLYAYRTAARGRACSGLELLGNRPAMVAASPILTKDGKGPSVGVLLFARYIDNDFVAGIADTIGRPVAFCSGAEQFAKGTFPSDATPDDIKSWSKAATEERVIDLAGHKKAVATPIMDREGHKVATLITIDPNPDAAFRDIILRWRTIVGAILAVVVALLIAIPLTRMVQNPLKLLANRAKTLADGDFRTRVDENGSGDVFDSMAKSFNTMAIQLDEAFLKTDQQKQEIEAQFATLQTLHNQMINYGMESQDLNERLQWQNSQLETLNSRLKQLALTDGLTGALNHRSFHERLASAFSEAVRYSAPFSVIMLDVDHFKQYNDRLGHPAGDVALREVAQVIQQVVRESDFAARYGGEEFAIGLPHTDLQGATVLAERIREKVQNLLPSGEPLTISGGVATLDTNFLTNPNDLVKAADNALYIAKRSGRNRIAVAPNDHRLTA